MAARRDKPPPLEVMKNIKWSRSTSAGSSAPGPSGHGPQAVPAAQGGQAWTRLQQPVVLRLPSGYLVLIALGVVLLLVVAYSAGYSQGSSHTDKQWRARGEAEQGVASRLENRMTRADDTSAGSSGGPGATSATAGTGNNAAGGDTSQAPARGVYDDPSQDPRKPGYQYFIVSHGSREEAVRLVAFFAQRGVESAAVVVHNRPNQYVTFVLRPFTRNQTYSKEAESLKQQILAMGKIWASHEYRGPTNLSSTYMALYNPSAD